MKPMKWQTTCLYTSLTMIRSRWERSRLKHLPTDHKRKSWRLQDIAFNAIDATSVRDDEFLFLTLTSASFVEILAETYSQNLIEYFGDNSEITHWLQKYWRQEEVQHGRALKRYVQTVWPKFDWNGAYDAFRAEYSALCTVEQLEPCHALELVARCVVETGTSTFYRAVQDYVSEPVLHQLLGNIQADETGHYRQFRHFLSTYSASDPQSAWAVIATIWRRMREVRGQDAYIAFKHVHAGRHPNKLFLESDWQRYSQMVKCRARRHYPVMMAVKMLIKPIPIAGTAKRILQWPMLGLARIWMLYP
jgi:rubrerythrin